MIGEDSAERGGRDLFFTFDEYCHTDRGTPLVRSQCCQVNGDTGLIVNNASGVQPFAALGGSERIRCPQVGVAGGLNIVVGVQADGG